MKQLLTFLILLICITAFAQKEEARKVGSFSKITVSPHISLILIKGEKESVRLLCNNVDPSKVNVRTKGSRLQIYLDDARIVEKQIRKEGEYGWQKSGIYHDVTVTAYVTYRELKDLEIRGESELVADEPIVSRKLKLRAYGECEIRLAAVNADKFKASLFGENRVKIQSGEVNRQVYRIFGETKIDTKGLVCATASIRMFGEGKVSLNATDEVSLSAFGEPTLSVTGQAVIHRSLIFGTAAINRE